MSVAIQCDRCRGFADNNAAGWYRVEWYLAFPPPPGKLGDKEIPHLDLCAKCVKEFNEFMGGGIL
jgi:hypothetical protein